MSRMHALLAHQGPLVHVDHAHRLAGPEDATGSWNGRWMVRAKNPSKDKPKVNVKEALSEVGIEMGMQKRRLLDMRIDRHMTRMDMDELLFLAEMSGMPNGPDKWMRATQLARLDALVAMAVEGYPTNMADEIRSLVRDIGALAARRAALEAME